jgi:hypothetical protein
MEDVVDGVDDKVIWDKQAHKHTGTQARKHTRTQATQAHRHTGTQGADVIQSDETGSRREARRPPTDSVLLVVTVLVRVICSADGHTRKQPWTPVHKDRRAPSVQQRSPQHQPTDNVTVADAELDALALALNVLLLDGEICVHTAREGAQAE